MTTSRSFLLAALAALGSACATAPISVADRQAASDAQVDLAVCVTEGDKPNFFFNPLPKMLVDQVESRYRPPKRPSFNRLTRLPYGADPSGCEVVIAMRADGQAIWNLRHAIVTNAATKEELLHTSSQQACGPCFAGMMDGLILPIIKALDNKGPLHAAVRGGGGARRPAVAAASEAPEPASMSLFAAKKRPAPRAGGVGMLAAASAPPAVEPAAPPPDAPASPAAPAEPAVEPEPVVAKTRSIADFSSKELSELDAQIFP